MKGLREIAISQLSDSGILIPKEKRVIQETVFPWILERIEDFLLEDHAIVNGSVNVVTDGIFDA